MAERVPSVMGALLAASLSWGATTAAVAAAAPGQMLGNGMIIVGAAFQPGDERFGNAGPAAATAPPYEGVGPDELEGARKLGQRLAEIAQRVAG